MDVCGKILTLLYGIVLATTAMAQSSPQAMSLQGKILDASNTPVEAASVTFAIQILSPGIEQCLLYQETQTINMSGSGGIFSLPLGAGTRSGAGFENTSSLATIFNNASGALTGLTCLVGTSYAPSGGAIRKIKLTFDAGTGPQVVTQTLDLQAVPFALYADSLQGRTPANFLQTSAQTTQIKVDNLALDANYNELLALIAGTSTQYALPNGSNFTPAADVNLNSHKIINLTAPTAGTDAVNKTYSDTKLGGAALDTTGLTTNGQSIRWNNTLNKWEVYTPSTTDSTKLPLAGGTMTGAIDMGGYNLLATGHITMSPQKTLNLGTYTDAQETTLVGTLGAVDKGKTWYNTDQSQIKMWTGAAPAAVVLSGNDIGTSAGKVMAADAVPNCLATQKLQMSLGPVYSWTCVTDQTGTDTQWTTTGSDIYFNTGNVGIGTATPGSKLSISQTDTTTTGSISLHKNSFTFNPSANALGALRVASENSASSQAGNTRNFATLLGVTGDSTHNGSGTVSAVKGGSFSAANSSTGTVSMLTGIESTVSNAGTGSVMDMYGGYFDTMSSNGSITNMYGVYVSQMSTSGSISAANRYGVYIDTPVGTTTTADYGLFQEGANQKNYFAGSLGIGTTSPGANLHVRAANNPEIKLTNEGTAQYTSPYITFENTEVTDGNQTWKIIASKDSAGAATGGSTFAIRRGNPDQSIASTPFVIDTSNNIILEGGWSTGGQTYGKVGIGTVPVALLDVAGDIKIGNSSATCDGTTAGSQRYNTTSNKMEFCNGTTWANIDTSGGGGTVTSVSVTAPLGVTNGTTTPALTISDATTGAKGVMQVGSGLAVSSGTVSVDSGTTGSKIVALDGTGKLPAVDGSALTNVVATSYSGTVPVNKGGTGATDAATARTNLGLAIGTDVQAYDAQLADIAGLTTTADNFIVGNGSNFVLKTPADARTSLGLGTAAVLNTGTGSTDLASNNAVPNCTSGQKLQMSAGPIYSWSCVTDIATQWTTTASDIYYTTGNVGIGTAGPVSPLHVAKTVDGAAQILTVDNTQANSAGSTNETAEIHFNFAGVRAGKISAYKESDFSNATNRDSGISIYSERDGSPKHGLSIAPNGNIAAGSITTPLAPLHIGKDVATAQVRLESTNFFPAPGDVLGSITIYAADTTSWAVEYGSIQGKALDSTNGSIDGTLEFHTTVNNTSAARMSIVDGNVGIGTTTVTERLMISTDGGANPSNVVNEGFGASVTPQFIGRRALGSAASPSAVVQDSTLAQFGGRGYGTNAWSTTATAAMEVHAGENWTNTAQGGYLLFGTTPAGSTTRSERMRITADGNVAIGTTSPLGKLDVVAASNTRLLLNTDHLDLTTDADAGGWARAFRITQGNNTNGQDGGAFGVVGAGSTPSYAYMAIPTADSTGYDSSKILILNNSGNMGIGTTSPTTGARLDITGTGSAASSIIIPRDTVANRPAVGVNGMIRYATDTNKFEAFQNGSWIDVIGTASSLSAGNGSVGSPSMSFSGDSNTGFYSNGADTIGISANGANVFNISSTTLSSPTTGGALITSGNGTAAAPAFSFTGDTGTGWWRPAASTMAASTGGVERMRIDSSGNVGIGTNAPASLLDISGNTNALSTIWVRNSNNGATARTMLNLANDNADYSSIYIKSSTAASDPGGLVIDSNSAGAKATLFSQSGVEKMRIDTNGNVGIGTISPAQALHVVRNNAQSRLQLESTGVSNGSAGVEIKTTDGGQWNIWMDDDSNDDLGEGDRLAFSYGTSHPMVLDGSSGNVGIGTISPTNAGLIVNKKVGDTYAIFGQGTSNALGMIGGGDAGVSMNAYFNSGWKSVGAGYSGYAAFDPVGGDYYIYTSSSSVGAADSSVTTLTNRFFINELGNIGIANTAPSSLLHVGSATTTAGTAVAKFETATGVCTMTPATSGTGMACSSDERLKKNIEFVAADFALESLLQLDAVTYEFKKDPSGKRYTGFLAQQVQKVAPEFVRENDDGMLQVYYDGLIPWITNAIKALHSRITELITASERHSREIASIKTQAEAEKAAKDKEIAELKSRLEKLEKSINSR